jgi:hypothetical protein
MVPSLSSKHLFNLLRKVKIRLGSGSRLLNSFPSLSLLFGHFSLALRRQFGILNCLEFSCRPPPNGRHSKPDQKISKGCRPRKHIINNLLHPQICPRPVLAPLHAHEILAAAGDNVGPVLVGPQVLQNLKHRLVYELRIEAASSAGAWQFQSISLLRLRIHGLACR